MKKSLLALAVLSSFAVGAQAQSSVTVYGVMDMALQYQDMGAAAGSTTALDSGIQAGSRLGFKGSEDLGSGLKANFQLEMGINADTGASAQGGTTFGRQAYVGLSGDFGAVNLGRQYTPVFIAIDSFDPFSTGMTSSTAGYGTSGFGAAEYFDHGGVRMNNSITYSTNNMGGFAVNAAYGMGTETPGNTSSGRYIGLSGTYTAGPLFLELAYSDSNTAVPSPLVSTKSYLLAGTYNFGAVTLHGAFQQIENGGAVTVANYNKDRQVYSIGASVPVGAGTFIANYINSNNDAVNAANASQIAVGYTHALSKRTNLFTTLSQAENDANARFGSSDVEPAAGKTAKMFNVGIRHKF